jgi:hypothetical protein
MAQDINQLAAYVRQGFASIQGQLDALKKTSKAPSLEEEIESIQGRRVMFNFTQTQTFTANTAGTKGSTMNYVVSTDGPFIMTHYPVAMWKSTLPTSATDFGRWRTVSSNPLPTQQLTTNFIDISYEMSDSGSGRNLQDNPASPALLSYPAQLIALEKPMVFLPNTIISVIVTYEAITFGGSSATTSGSLAFSLPGYKIITSLGNGF